MEQITAHNQHLHPEWDSSRWCPAAILVQLMSAERENALIGVNNSVESSGSADGYRDFRSRSEEDDHQKVDRFYVRMNH